MCPGWALTAPSRTPQACPSGYPEPGAIPTARQTPWSPVLPVSPPCCPAEPQGPAGLAAPSCSARHQSTQWGDARRGRSRSLLCHGRAVGWPQPVAQRTSALYLSCEVLLFQKGSFLKCLVNMVAVLQCRTVVAAAGLHRAAGIPHRWAQGARIRSSIVPTCLVPFCANAAPAPALLWWQPASCVAFTRGAVGREEG